jgi:hypothetical protein
MSKQHEDDQMSEESYDEEDDVQSEGGDDQGAYEKIGKLINEINENPYEMPLYQ